MSKGDDTKERILDRAFRLAARDGLEGLSLGALAAELGMSKSGLFAHFTSKEELQVATLSSAALRFTEEVAKKAFAAPRGLPRVRALFRQWLGWMNDPGHPGGCLFIAASVELDDKPGVARDLLVATEKELLSMIAKTARLAVEEGHFRKGLDCDQFAYEAHALILAYHHAKRLLKDPKADARVKAAFDRLTADASTPQ